MINILREKNTKKKGLFKEAFKYPHLEEMELGTHYALSINPSHQQVSFIDSYLEHQQILELLKPLCEFELRPEISTKTTRLHYHGRIKFNRSFDWVAFYYHCIPKLKDLCTFTIEPIIDYEWYLYCIKARHFMKVYLQHLKLPYRLTNDNLGLIEGVKHWKK